MGDVFTISENALDDEALGKAVTRLEKSGAYTGIKEYSEKKGVNGLTITDNPLDFTGDTPTFIVDSGLRLNGLYDPSLFPDGNNRIFLNTGLSQENVDVTLGHEVVHWTTPVGDGDHGPRFTDNFADV